MAFLHLFSSSLTLQVSLLLKSDTSDVRELKCKLERNKLFSFLTATYAELAARVEDEPSRKPLRNSLPSAYKREWLLRTLVGIKGAIRRNGIFPVVRNNVSPVLVSRCRYCERLRLPSLCLAECRGKISLRSLYRMFTQRSKVLVSLCAVNYHRHVARIKNVGAQRRFRRAWEGGREMEREKTRIWSRIKIISRPRICLS